MRFPSGQKHRHWGTAFMTSWQLIFLQSRVNNGAYGGDYLPAQKWDWPRDTWFQTRLCYQRVQRGEIAGNRSRAQEIELKIDRFLGEKSRSRSISGDSVLAHQQKVRIPGQGLKPSKVPARTSRCGMPLH